MIAVELTGAVNAAGTLKTFYLSDGQFSSLPTDSPSNQAFEPVLTGFSLASSVFADRSTTGGSGSIKGEMVIANDGQFDDWLNYGFDGRPIIFRSGAGAYPAGYTTLFQGIVETVTVGLTNVVISLRDLQAVFAKAVLTNFYAGNNVLPNGLEGVADLKGKPKPKVFGSVFNWSPVLVNTSKLTYQVNDGAVFSITVRDKGVLLTNQGDFATSAALQAASFSTGYATCLAEGYFRLGAAPAGKVTADVLQGASASARSVSAVLRALAILAGVPVASLDADAFSALQSSNPAVVGIVVEGDKTFGSAMDEVAQSIGAFYIFNGAGKLTVGVLTIPSGSPVAAFFEYDIQSGITRRPARDNNVPAFTVALNYNKNYSPAGNDLAGSVGAAQSAVLSTAYQTERASDTSVKTQFLNAEELEIDTLLTAQADASAEAARLLAIYKLRRDVFEVPMHFDSLPASPLYLMAVVSLTYRRFGLDAGRSFRLLGLTLDMRSRRAVLTLWG